MEPGHVLGAAGCSRCPRWAPPSPHGPSLRQFHVVPHQPCTVFHPLCPRPSVASGRHSGAGAPFTAKGRSRTRR